MRSHEPEIPVQQSKRLAPAALLFRPPFLERAAAGTHVPMLTEIMEAVGVAADHIHRPLCTILDEVFGMLVEHYRCEYVFKNAIATDILMDFHSPEKARLLSEFRSGSCRADAVIVNGTSSVYEVKTDLDSLGKLQKQLNSYRSIFDKIYVVASSSMCDKVAALIDDDVGIFSFTDNAQLKSIRKSASHKELVSPSQIFDCMRRDEYVGAITKHFGQAPTVPNTQIYTECKKLFCELSPIAAHAAMVHALKRRTEISSAWHLVGKVPSSLTYLCLTTTGSPKMLSSLERALLSPCVT